MAISEEIRSAVKDALNASRKESTDPFVEVLQEVANGLTDEQVEAGIRKARGGLRWYLWLAPAHRPGQAVTMLSVVIQAGHARVLLSKEEVANTREELFTILKRFVTSPAFLESMQEMAERSTQPVEGYLRIAAGMVSRDDLMLEVSADDQRRIAEASRQGQEVRLDLRIADFPGAGRFGDSIKYMALQCAGYRVELTSQVTQSDDGRLRIVGRVARDQA